MAFFLGHMGSAERFGAISYQHEGLRSHVGELVVILCAEKIDFIFLDDALFTFDALNRCFSLEHEKGLRRQVIVHVCVLPWTEVEYPRAKSLCAKKRNKPLILLFSRPHGVIDIGKFHSLSFDCERVIPSVMLSLWLFFSLSDRVEPHPDRPGRGGRVCTIRDSSGVFLPRGRW